MNRQQRRNLGITKATSDKLDQLNTKCTILEAIQLAQGVSEDAISNYHKSLNPIVVSLSIQVEILKEILSEAGALDLEKFQALFEERVEDYNSQREKALRELENSEKISSDVKTDINPQPVQVDIIKND